MIVSLYDNQVATPPDTQTNRCHFVVVTDYDFIVFGTNFGSLPGR